MVPVVTDILETVSIDDPLLNNISYSESHLLVYLWQEGMAYAIYNRVENCFLSLHEIQAGSKDKYAESLNIFSSRPVFEKRFKEVRIAIDERIFTLVPRSLFDSKAILQYLDLFHPQEKETIGKDVISAADAVNVYTLPLSPVNKLKALFLSPDILSTSTVLLQQCLTEHKHRRDDLLFAHLHQHRLDIIALEKGRLVFYNRFRVEALEDVSYYLLAVADQASFNTDTVRVILNGADIQSWLPAAQKYFQYVEQGGRPRAFQYAADIQALPQGAFYPLFSLNACEL